VSGIPSTSRFVAAANVFPTGYGLVPATKIPDGNQFDVLAIVQARREQAAA
jgi:inorganic pyrophosphatase